jgi:GTP-binding protein
MQIRSAEFIKGIVKEDELLSDGKPQICFIGRSNVGKSSVINALTNKKGLARTSSTPGRTQQINLFLINRSFYLVDLPGYGFAKMSQAGQDDLQALIKWYLWDSGYKQKKVVLIIDAKVGPTVNDLEMLRTLEEYDKEVIVVANKVDKIKSSERTKQLSKIKQAVGDHEMIPCSAMKKIGLSELSNQIQ